MVEPWDVFYVRDCRHTTPRKNKFVAIAHLETAPHGFLVDSRINPFIYRQGLWDCEAEILGMEHDFLREDSYVECREVFPFTLDELDDPRGSLSPEAVEEVRAAVDACRVLPRKHKRWILGTG